MKTYEQFITEASSSLEHLNAKLKSINGKTKSARQQVKENATGTHPQNTKQVMQTASQLVMLIIRKQVGINTAGV